MRTFGLFTVAAMGLCIATANSAAAQEHVFKLHHLLGAKAPAQTQMLEPWARQVEENAAGRVKIEIYPAMTLGGRPQELVQQVRDGVVDIIWTVNGYTPGIFPDRKSVGSGKSVSGRVDLGGGRVVKNKTN